ncbi:branched-chain amino acid transport system II carrier protein [Pectobacterium actinidiae]|uniref:Branched-chain amino acid transport system carrier protein n=1 Tax=Pectobacterium actinidiae TaxID=1507808 RepID=A0ABW8G6I6_9GAMM
MVKFTAINTLALSFMIFALFVGAGNIIYPPFLALHSGENTWIAAAGFMVTGVGLPVISIVALARYQGSMRCLCRPLGDKFSILFTVVCYLTVGPLFSTPRTATVSFETGLSNYFGNSHSVLFIYSLFFFVVVIYFSLTPGKLLDRVGYVLSPLKIVCLSILGVAAYLWPAGSIGPASPELAERPFSSGIMNGYLTMDTLGALVLGIVVYTAIKSKGVESEKQIFKYTVIATLIAGSGLLLLYLSLFFLGAGSFAIASDATNGAVVLQRFVHHTFGDAGALFLALLITLACLVTAIGLTCACSEYFCSITRISYRNWVFLVSVFSFCVSNIGLTSLIHLSIPILTVIYPPCIVMIIFSFLDRILPRSRKMLYPAAVTSLIFGLFDACKNAGLNTVFDKMLNAMPLSGLGLAWCAPCLATICLTEIFRIMRGKYMVNSN